MAEVGVLNLTIRDNSEQAAGGLEKLATALASVKSAISGGIKLSGVATSLQNLVAKVQGSSATISQLTSLFNALKNFQKLGDFKLNVQPIVDLKNAIGPDGLKLGQAGTQLKNLREALSGNFAVGNMISAMSNLSGTVATMKNTGVAQTLTSVAKAMKEYSEAAKAMGSLQASGGAAGDWRSAMMGGGVASTTSGRSSMMKLNLQQFGGHAKEDISSTVKDINEVNSALAGVNAGSIGQLRELAAALKDIGGSGAGSVLMDFAAGIKELNGAIKSGANSYHTLTYLATAINKFKGACDGFALPSFTKLTNLAQSLQENWNTENALKGIAQGMEAIKKASEGFAVPDVKGLERASAVLNGSAETGAKGAVQGAMATATGGTEMKNSVVEATSALEQNKNIVDLDSKSVEELVALYKELEQALDVASKTYYPARDKLAHALSNPKTYKSQIPGLRQTFETERERYNGLLEQLSAVREAIYDKGAISRIFEKTSDGSASGTQPVKEEMIETAAAATEASAAVEKTADAIDRVASGDDKIGVIEDIPDLSAKATEATGALEALGEAKEAMDSKLSETNGAGADAGKAISESIPATTEAAAAANDLKVAFDQATGQFAAFTSAGEKVTEVTEEQRAALDGLNAALRESSEATQRAFESGSAQLASDRLSDYISQPQGATEVYTIEQPLSPTEQLEAARENLDAFLEHMDEAKMTVAAQALEMEQRINELADQEQALRDALALDVQSGNVSSEGFIERANAIRMLESEQEKLLEQLKELQHEQSAVGKISAGLSSAWNGLKSAFHNSGVGKLITQFKNLAKRMAMRAIIRQFTSGIKEGVENVYRYSQAIGSSFAPAMDEAASSLAQMKNSFGAALAPAIQAIIPILQTVINWFIDAINVVNQFLSLLRGQTTWTRANKQTVKAFDDTTKAAKGAGGAIKDLLADWDELNIIQSEGGGGGGGGTDAMQDYLGMFEEVSVFDKKVRDVVGFLQDNMGGIKTLAVEAGAAILGWKLSTVFAESAAGVLGQFIGLGATIAITATVTDITGKEYGKTGEAGWLIADALTGAVGATVAASIAAKLGGSLFAKVGAGFTLTIAGIVNVSNASGLVGSSVTELSARGWMLGALGAVEAGIGTALSFAGLGASTTVSVAAGAIAVAGVAVALGIHAEINASKKDIEWGSYNLTAAEIQAYVNDPDNGMFNVDVQGTLQLISATVTASLAARESIRTQVSNLLPFVQSLKIGVDTTKSLEAIKTGIFGDDENGGLISKVKEYAEQKTIELETTFSFIPFKGTDGTDQTQEVLAKGIEGLEGATRIMDDLGAELSGHLTKSMNDNLKEGLKSYERNAVAEITSTMISLSNALTQSEITSSAQAHLATNLGDLSSKSAYDILHTYGLYREELTKGFTQLYENAMGTYSSLYNYYEIAAQKALKEAGGDETNEEYLFYHNKAQEFKDLYDNLFDTIAEQVKIAVDYAASGNGARKIRSALLEKGILSQYNQTYFSTTQQDVATAWAYVEQGNDASVDKVLDVFLKKALTEEDYNVYKEAINSGLIDITEMFTEDFLYAAMKDYFTHRTTYRPGENMEDDPVYKAIVESYYRRRSAQNPYEEERPFQALADIDIPEYVASKSIDEMAEEVARYGEMTVSELRSLYPTDQEIKNLYNYLLTNGYVQIEQVVVEGNEAGPTMEEMKNAVEGAQGQIKYNGQLMNWSDVFNNFTPDDTNVRFFYDLLQKYNEIIGAQGSYNFNGVEIPWADIFQHFTPDLSNIETFYNIIQGALDTGVIGLQKKLISEGRISGSMGVTSGVNWTKHGQNEVETAAQLAQLGVFTPEAIWSFLGIGAPTGHYFRTADAYQPAQQETIVAGPVNSDEYQTQSAYENQQRAEQSGLLREIVAQLQKIYGKNFVVNVTPTSEWGEHIKRSSWKYDKVTGV